MKTGRRTPRGVVLVATAVLVLGNVLGASPANAAVTSSVNGGVLTVTGDQADDVIIVQCNGGNVVVNGANPSTGSEPCSSITEIRVHAGGGYDNISLVGASRALFDSLTDVVVHGDGGNDGIVGSPDADSLFGDDGFDSFYLVEGDDAIEGGADGDTVTVSTRHDVVLTPSSLTTGEDAMTIGGIETVYLTSAGRGLRFDARTFRGAVYGTADRGDDVLLGGSGGDTLSGGGGGDRLVGGPGTDYLVGGRGNDVLIGGPGSDYLDGSSGHDRCESAGGVVTGCEA